MSAVKAGTPWSSVLLDSVARRGSGHTPDKKHPEYWNGAIKWISLKDSERLDKQYIDDTEASITPAGIANSSAVEHPPGTVVLSRDAGVGKSAITRDVMAVSQHFMAWQCGSRLDNHFLYYWLQFKKPEFERVASGNTIKTIGLPYFKALKVPLPDINEQRAISAALSDIDAFLGGLDRLVAKKRDLKQAVMQQLLTGQTRLPGFAATWETKRLGDLARMSSGGTPPSGDPRYYDGDVPWVSISDMTKAGKFVGATERNLTQAGLENSAAVIYPTGTVLYAMYASIGECCIAAIPTSSSQAILGIQPGSTLSSEYLYYWMCAQKAEVKKLGQHGTQANLNASIVRAFMFSVPHLTEQKAIAAVLSDMDAEIAALEARRDKTRLLKQGMMQELLTGRTRLV